MNIQPFIHLKTASDPAYHPNGETISFLTNYTGVPQVWALNKGEGWPTQISFENERVMFVSYIKGTTKRIIGMDEGVNEKQQLFLLEDNGSLIPLTDAPEYIHQYGDCSPDGKRIAWSSNRRDPRYFDLYVQDLASKEFEAVYEGEGTYSVLKWHPNEDALLIQKSNSNLDHDLGLLDLASKEIHWFTKHEGEATFRHAHFSPDGNSVYVLTNLNREYLALAEIDIATRELTWLEEQNWDLEGLTFHSQTNVCAYTINEGGVSKAVLFDLKENKKEIIDTPQGVIEQLHFSPTGEQLAFVLNGATHPADIWEYDLKTGQLERLTYVSHSPAVQQELIEPDIIAFTSFDGLTIPAFYYKPKKGEGPYPVVVFVHGGPESQIRSVYNPFLQYFLHRGYAVCTPNVRGSTGYGKTYVHLDDVRKRMDSVKDLVALTDWLKAEGNADPDQIAVMGRSYGGFMVLAAVTHYPEYWAAGIDIVGISSFKTFLQNTGKWRRKLREAEYGSLENDADFFDQIDPMHHTSKITAPLIVLHGANDPRVPIEEAEQIVEDLRKRNHPVEYIRFEDEGHFFIKTKNNIIAYTEVANFLDQWLGSERNESTD